MTTPMTDCHDWFAEVAETYARYLVAKAGFEVFGQSEWGADLAIRDSATKLWARCEVRSSDCNDEPKRKKSGKLAASAELCANVTLVQNGLRVVFYKLNEKGHRIQTASGGPAVSHAYDSHTALKEWLRANLFAPQPTAGTLDSAEAEVMA
jgi:hypothetical protein